MNPELTPQNFVIIGALPRSGTAWLAAALNLHPDIMAFHEGALTEQGYTARMESSLATHKAVVDVTTNLNPSFDCIPARRFFLHRSPGRCLKSSAAIFGQEAYDIWAQAQRMANVWRAKHSPLVFSYDEMFESREQRGHILKTICTALSLPFHFDPKKLDQLASMNVQMHGLKPGYFADKIIQTVP